MNRFAPTSTSVAVSAVQEKEEKWLEHTHKTMDGGVYCTTFGGGYDLDTGWKCDKDRVIRRGGRSSD
jgi:hypothetical protein